MFQKMFSQQTYTLWFNGTTANGNRVQPMNNNVYMRLLRSTVIHLRARFVEMKKPTNCQIKIRPNYGRD